jgi:hypothetical protein
LKVQGTTHLQLDDMKRNNNNSSLPSPANQYQLVNFIQNIAQNGASPGSYILMNREREAAEYSMQTGIYGVWRSRKNIYDKPQDCSRIGPTSLCFCGHSFQSHNSKLKPFQPPCTDCKCDGFSFVPSRPEEIGEWWLPMRADFDERSWSCKCRCGHSHKDHAAKGIKKCLNVCILTLLSCIRLTY